MAETDLLPYHYLLINKIGYGSYGRCFMAVNVSTHKYVACKIMEVGHECTSEANIHANLKHDNIVKFLEEIKTSKHICLIMELCPFGTLDDLLQCRTKLTDQEVRCISRQIVLGVAYLHGRLVIHRDLKLTNILIASKFTIKISDFGLSAKVSHAHKKRQTICGTLSYMAPEMTKDESHGFPVDIWAIGCIVYSLLEGRGSVSEKIPKAAEKKRALSSGQTALTRPALIFLQATLTIDPKHRPTAPALLHNEYIAEECSAVQLNISSFYQETNAASSKLKRLPLRDETNLQHETKYHEKEPAKAKFENETVVEQSRRMTLRSRYKMPTFLKEPIEAIIWNKGKNVARHLAGCLSTCLMRRTETSGKLSQSDRPLFLFVMRWVAGVDTLGYNLSDGSLAVDFGKDLVFYKRRSEEQLLSPHVMNVDSLSEENKKHIRRTVKHVTLNLSQLEECGPANNLASKERNIIVSWKFFYDVVCEDMAEPVASFLISNGSCQVNFSNHEKLLVNAPDDLIACWSREETRMGRLSDVLRWGPSKDLRSKLQFMCYYLTFVSHTTSN